MTISDPGVAWTLDTVHLHGVYSNADRQRMTQKMRLTLMFLFDDSLPPSPPSIALPVRLKAGRCDFSSVKGELHVAELRKSGGKETNEMK